VTTLFVTAAGTDIGKTYVCCRLIENLSGRYRLRCIKPVVSGFDPCAIDSTDTALLLRAQGRTVDAAAIEATSPWRFSAALSADMAAARESRRIPMHELLAFSEPGPDIEINLIEGIGGVMSPIDDEHTVLDWIAALDTKTLLVSGSYLGSLSHTLTAFEVLAHRGKTPIAIVVSQSVSEPIRVEETVASLARHCHDIPITVLRRGDQGREQPSVAIIERRLML